MNEAENNEAAMNAALDGYRAQVAYWKRRAVLMGSALDAIDQMAQEHALIPSSAVRALTKSAVDGI